MKTRTEIISTLSGIIADQLYCDASRVTPDSRIASDLDTDSLDRMEIIMAAEEEFGIALPDRIADSDMTVSQFADMVESTLKEQCNG